jgi:uncharacterized tellurite resistance protein B-like protein
MLPPPEQGVLVLRALKTLALADGEMHPQELRLIEIASEVLGLEVEVEALQVIEPDALAEGLTEIDSREALMKRLVLLSTLDSEVSEEEVALLERYGSALGVAERAVHNMRQLVQGHVRRMAFDLARRSFAPTLLKSFWSKEGLAGLWKLAKAILGLTDAKLAARFEALGELSEDTLGYGIYHQFVDNGFPYPGQKHGVPADFLFHDLGHVLSGYSTQPEGELKVAGFQAGYLDEDPLVMYLMIAMLFQLGIEPIAKARGVPAHRGLFDIDTFMEAFDRGRALRRNLLHWDPWPHMKRPLEEVRRELGVPPLATADEL